MSAQILLDPEGDLPARSGVQVIESKADFLRYAVSGQALLIRRVRLCQSGRRFLGPARRAG